MPRQWLFLLPCALGALSLFLARRAGDGSPGFFAATLATAAIYGLAWWVWGNRSAFAGPRKLDDVALGILSGLALALVFFLGALVVARIPFLAEPATELLATPEKGGLAPTLAVLVLNGVGEELVYRDMVPRQLRLLGMSINAQGLWSTLLYTLITVAMGVPLLLVGACLLGALAFVLAARTGRCLAPIAAHLTWSTSMALVLPLLFTR
ncbi:CPBP family intramembrane metalloprotease [Corynebacterium imitans]|uniref:CPBP family intramembrane glutamic endopeptidase n=1 Tax=Corynebacterium imitans TaxID=156978 RepID=UPI002550F53A|nr:CPBP family intramembrane glutamic endopeptidase [Corynebacterium imitans]MDK8306530.1 CPBP family intramembrane metalloprotease [Corynebacterium imitans]MDK8637499.1 CPBP family intramembrane metalloprotease [Corynebacterium imitans]MDK8772602.1 CPBP family intramembrane metalloprotease [Corynebacterium imitans]